MRSERFRPVLLLALAVALVLGCGKAPLVPDAPRGPVHWVLDFATACTTSTTDPSGGQVSYQFDWGDGSKSQWSQFMDGGVSFADTHSYNQLGSFQIKARAKNKRRASGWSDPLSVAVIPSEGSVGWYVGFADPDDPGDSADFSLNSFALGPDNTAYVACDYGALIARKPSGDSWRFTLPDFDQFTAAPVVADDGTIFIGCSNDTVYIINSDSTVRSRVHVGGPVWATGALGADGTAYFQTEDSMVVALRPDGTTRWSFFSGGGYSAPVVGADGTVFAASQDGSVYAINPADGSLKWTYNLNKPIAAPPAIDPDRNVLYVVDNEGGALRPIDLAAGDPGWEYVAGSEASGPVVGPDGSVFIGGNGKLHAVKPDGTPIWIFVPTLEGVVSTPAVTADGYLYAQVTAGKRRLALQYADSLYAVNPDGTRRWACGLGEGLSETDIPLSAPKVDASGFIYVGNGYRGWCVVGTSPPAQSAWPMLQRDNQNTGRAR